MMFLCTLMHFCLTTNISVDTCTELFTNFFFTKKATLLKNTQVTWTGPYSLRNHILGTLWRVNITQATWPWKRDVRQRKRRLEEERRKICWDCNNNTVKYRQGHCFLLSKRNGGLGTYAPLLKKISFFPAKKDEYFLIFLLYSWTFNNGYILTMATSPQKPLFLTQSKHSLLWQQMH